MSCLLAAEAKTFLNANLSFLWSELPDMYGIHVHSIWVLGLSSRDGGEVRAYGRREGFVVFGSLGHDLVGLVPLGLEPFSFGIPFIDGGGYGVHGVDMVHECWIESFSNKGDKDGLVDYFTEVGSDFEFVDVGKDFVLGLGDGLEAGKGFALRLVVRNALVREFLKSAKVSNFLLLMVLEVKVVVHPRVDPFFINESAKAIFF